MLAFLKAAVGGVKSPSKVNTTTTSPKALPFRGGLKDCLAFTLRYEGLFSNNPADPGGATYKGVTLYTFRSFMQDQHLTAADLQKASDTQIESIYALRYWNAVQGDSLPVGIDLTVFDFAVNAGVSRSAKLLQTKLGFSGDDVDGWVGPATLEALKGCHTASLLSELLAAQEAHYRSLATFSTFGKGWLNRLNARAEIARGALS